ncbi:hypothetical protein [Ornithinimicrobium sp. INDO-MA30-4]|uniref:hypothetical protein n=1 Tax=Ornithinimicrobium sp. INDO-MA30-4 TaxID=2908651 RepID=UPI001F3C9780|nr:hypothetical protein [Ornithinimicrobium sp. INDO-MA30-4]UJH69663.1 hypothetical protein L0A91_10000 [Ornithinimicrobium sp. INDO-MA30-4]
MDKVDLTQQMPTYATRLGRFDLVEVPAMQFLMVGGPGDSNSAPEKLKTILRQPVEHSH